MGSESFFAELKRRKVFRVGTGYVVGAWVLLQLGDVVIEPLGLPNWIQAGLIYALVALFPIVLVLTWAYELTARGLVRDRGDQDSNADSTSPDPRVEGAHSIAPIDAGRRRLAVLPFVDIGDGGEDGHLAEGLALEILDDVSRQTQLQVVARTSSFRFDGRNADLAEVRGRLGATHALLGTARRAGERMRFSMQLIDLQEEVQVWAQTYNRLSDDIFEALAEVARAVVQGLLRALQLEGQTNPHSWAISPEAYEEYLIAMNAYRRTKFPTAIQHAENSIKLDGANPLAPVLLAETYFTWTRYGFAMGRDDFLLARKYVAQAQDVDPDFAPAKSIGGMLSLFLDRDFRRSFEQVSKAAAEQPGLVEWVPVLLSYANRYEESVELQRRMVQRDPLNPINLLTLANRLAWIGRNDEAVALCERARELDPTHLILRHNDYRWAIRDGELDRAEEMLREWGFALDDSGARNESDWPPHDVGLWLKARLRTARGETEEALRLAREIERGTSVTPTLIAETYVSAGAIDDAYRICDLGIRTFDLGIYDVARAHETRYPQEPSWLAFAADDRYPGLLERLGIDEASLKGIDWEIADRIMR